MSEFPRFGALDIGSNTVKLLVAERRDDGSFIPVYEEAHACRLGEGFAQKRLKGEAIERAISSLKYFSLQCRRFGTESVAAVGTSALRDATNASLFLAQARRLGFDIWVISGEEEARLSYNAVRKDPQWREAESLLIVDIGGGSTELAWGSAVQDHPQRVSLQIGAVRLTERRLPGDPPDSAAVDSARGEARNMINDVQIPTNPSAMVGVGGTCSNIGSVAACEAGTPERVHGRRLSLGEVDSQIDLYASLPTEHRKKIQGLDPSRADIILAGAIILSEAVNCAETGQVEISNRGLRWGLLYERYGG
jgi:exopolyphosphatase/guanosine-5'-triphosphate,3'-diphosphate pyrophosphatase